jgi:hypothetical protein
MNVFYGDPLMSLSEIIEYIISLIDYFGLTSYLLVSLLLVFSIKVFRALLEISPNEYSDDYDTVLPDPQRTVKEIPYKVRQRRLVKACQSCGTKLPKSNLTCGSCGYPNPKYEYRLVDRVRYEYE